MSHNDREDESRGWEELNERYDLATWRMYNRIVQHRLKYPTDTSYNGACHGTSFYAAILTGGTDSSPAHIRQETSYTVLDEDSVEDIFVMDL